MDAAYCLLLSNKRNMNVCYSVLGSSRVADTLSRTSTLVFSVTKALSFFLPDMPVSFKACVTVSIQLFLSLPVLGFVVFASQRTSCHFQLSTIVHPQDMSEPSPSSYLDNKFCSAVFSLTSSFRTLSHSKRYTVVAEICGVLLPIFLCQTRATDPRCRALLT